MNSDRATNDTKADGQKRRAELATFLRRRREALTPADVGLPNTGRRHVKGLRREEVAQLAGIGTSWYTLLEQGRVETIGERTMHGVADALHLSVVEREHLFALARAVRPQRRQEPPHASLIELVEGTTSGPVFLMSARYDLYAWNALADELFRFSDINGIQRNLLESMVLDPEMHEIFPTWQETVRNMIGVFRANYGRLGDDEFDEMIQRLRTESPFFARIWEAGVVDTEPETICVVRHPVRGLVTMHLMSFVPLAHPEFLVMHFVPVREPAG